MPTAFIAMPFAKKFDDVYETMRLACSKLGIKVIRIDEVWAREDIYKKIEEEILKCDFVIADFTGDRMFEVPNPNVVHEAAFARINKKYIVLLAQDHKCLPFDWRTRPAIIYQQNEQGLKYLKKRLTISIQALLDNEDFGGDNNSYLNNMFGAPQGYPYPASQQMYNYNQQNFNQQFVQNNPNNSEMTSIAILENILKLREKEGIRDKEAELPHCFTELEKSVLCETDGSIMTLIQSSSFKMGGDEDEDQQPIHEVSLSPYLIDIYPVTNEQFLKFIEAGGYQNKNYWKKEAWEWISSNNIQKPKYFDDPTLNKSKQPVVGISWYEAMAYCAWTNKHLPTEAQWEYAARGNDQRVYPWGSKTPTDKLSNYDKNMQSTTECGKFINGISPFGCHDMAGNVWEWCYDWYSEDYYNNSPNNNPVGPQNELEKVCRGGSWTYGADTLKSFYRFFGEPKLRDRGFGFRCARIL